MDAHKRISIYKTLTGNVLCERDFPCQWEAEIDYSGEKGKIVYLSSLRKNAYPAFRMHKVDFGEIYILMLKDKEMIISPDYLYSLLAKKKLKGIKNASG